MNRLAFVAVMALGALTLVSGCAAGYSWRPAVPWSMRTVSVPTFRNESSIVELGAIATRQALREFQREGTFEICAVGDSDVEVQGVITSARGTTEAYDRKSGFKLSASGFEVKAVVSVIDKKNRKVLIDNRAYTAYTTYTGGQDATTSQRDASGRAAEDLARQIVDDVLNYNWQGASRE